jgi:hypothetical protein
MPQLHAISRPKPTNLIVDGFDQILYTAILCISLSPVKSGMLLGT